MRRYKIADKAWLFHGDCLKVLPTLPQVDFIFTDPPYGHNNNDGDLIANREKALGRSTGENEEARPIANDDFDQANRVTKLMVKAAQSLLPKGGGDMSVLCRRRTRSSVRQVEHHAG